MMRLPPISFRTKLLIALVTAITLLLVVTLAVIRAETERQVERVVEAAVQQSGNAFRESERFWTAELERLGNSFAGPTRVAAALEAAVQYDDQATLVETTRYDQEAAQIERALFAYTDAEGAPVVALIDKAELEDATEAVPTHLVQGLLFEGDTTSYGYHVAVGRLYAVHVVPLFVPPGLLVGTITIGFPVDEVAAGRLGELAGASVCFVVSERCVAGSPGAGPDLRNAMVAAAGEDGRREVTIDGAVWGIAPQAMNGVRGGGWRVVAVPLAQVTTPYDRIRRAATLAGIGALGLALLIGVLLSRSFAKPIRALVAATARVGKGDYAARVDARSGDELGQLGRSFNEMAEGLQLKERYRGVLDKVVSPEIAAELMKGEMKLGGEIRHVTTLFADIRGFTPLTEGMEPQRVIALLNEYMERASAAIEDEGGVVDKYVGDEVMGVFGAPVSRGRDSVAAVGAALRIRDAMRQLSAERVERGDGAVPVGIGINTGAAVAGNMGSQRRLNYTVLGESVNVAARLCDIAGPHQVLISGATYAELADVVDVRALEPVRLKGLSYPLEIFEVLGVRGAASSTDGPGMGLAAPAATAAGGALRTLALTLTGILGAATAGGAQEMPTLESLAWSSESGFVQIRPGGRLDLELYVPQGGRPWIIPSDRAFVAGRALLTTDLFIGERVFATAELHADRGQAPADRRVHARVQQAFVRWSPVAGYNLHVQAGKFVSPFGSYPQRHHSEQDPFIRPPLHYDWRTVVTTAMVPRANDGFLTWKDDVPGEFRPLGAPPVWGSPYQTGAMLLGGFEAVSFRLAIMSSAPSSEPGEWNRFFGTDHGPSLVAHAGWQVRPELRLGLSYNTGSYLQDDVPQPAYSFDISSYTQRLWGVEATFARGPLEVRAEGVHDVWEVPNVADEAIDVSYYLEAKWKVRAGAYAAARYGAIAFNQLELDAGGATAWDYDVRRLQVGGGYRLSLNTGLRAEYAWTGTERPDAGAADLLSLQWWWAL